MTPLELLDAYVENHRIGEYSDSVDTEAPGLTAALRAVLDLHTPWNTAYQFCSAERDIDGDQVPWPCPTVKAITTALEAE